MAGIPRHVVRSSTSAAANVVMPVRAPCSKSMVLAYSRNCSPRGGEWTGGHIDGDGVVVSEVLAW